jgi:hypothetical protein
MHGKTRTTRYVQRLHPILTERSGLLHMKVRRKVLIGPKGMISFPWVCVRDAWIDIHQGRRGVLFIAPEMYQFQFNAYWSNQSKRSDRRHLDRLIDDMKVDTGENCSNQRFCLLKCITVRLPSNRGQGAGRIS